MKPNFFGGGRPNRSRVSLLFGVVFLLAAIRWVIVSWSTESSVVEIVSDSRFWLVGLIGLLFMGGTVFPKLRVGEPYVLLLLAIIPYLEFAESLYGFGFFAVGAIMLFADGQLTRRPLLKLPLLGGYLLSLLIASNIFNRTEPGVIVGEILFMTTFFLYLFLTFQDKIIVFVKAAKPVVKLQERGLSSKETEHLLALLEGKSMKEIAWAQGVKESTVRNSLSRTYHKLGFTDKTQLLQWAENYEIRP